MRILVTEVIENFCGTGSSLNFDEALFIHAEILAWGDIVRELLGSRVFYRRTFEDKVVLS